MRSPFTMEVLSINDNDDNDQVNPPEIISPLGLRFSNFSPVGFVKEDLLVSWTPHINIKYHPHHKDI